MGGVMSNIIGGANQKINLLNLDFDTVDNGDEPLRSLLPPDPYSKEDTKPIEIYKDVRTYPKDHDFLKYFEKIPHPERIDPKLLAILEANPKVDLNPSLQLLKLEFELMKQELGPKFSDIDKEILKLPGIMEEQMKKTDNGDRKKSAEHLMRSFYRYFISRLNDPTPPS